MRRLLILLALLGLLYSPAAAVAAQQACVEAGAEMTGMTMAVTTSDPTAPSAPDPCCDHSKETMDSKACAQACATMCGISAALPSADVHVAPQPKAAVVADRVLPLKARPPPRTERPPKSIA
ncbi:MULTISPECIES: hypothetical protein [unclassified Phenylobacterium]|uniref:hypothetical protein n=1 Tax=unclassified Phenylobacterium TaxID=2640670 RepID=UPI00083B18C1|nr:MULTISPECIES: hypothetical protein [unclassified Phenylobacterium]